MIRLVYDLLQCLMVLCALPKFLWQRAVQGKFKGCFASYLGLSLLHTLPKRGKVFLIYAVSMGETKAAASLFETLKQKFPDDQFYTVSRTATGRTEARKSLSKADGHFLLPLDFSWAMNRFLKKIKPDVPIS